MRPELSIVHQYAASLSLHLSEPALERLDLYLDSLLRWRGRVNLIGSTDARTIVSDHFCDAVAAASIPPLPLGASAVDIGSGAGLPGIPIAIMRPDLRMTLVDAMRKRVAFLEYARSVIGADWRVIWGRAELLGQDARYRGRYDIAFERAVAPLQKSAPLVIPFLSTGGLGVFMKGRALSKDATIDRLVHQLGAVVEATTTYRIPGDKGQVRTLALVRKIRD